MRSHEGIDLAPQDKAYIRNRENPFFDGLVTRNIDEAAASIFDFQRRSSNTSRSVSDILGMYDQGTIFSSDHDDDNNDDDKVNNNVLQPSDRRSLSERWSNIDHSKTNSFPFLTTSNNDLYGSLTTDLTPETFEENIIEGCDTKTSFDIGLSVIVRPSFTFKKSYSYVKFNNKNMTMEKDLSMIPVPQSAASYYNGWLPQIQVAESCQGIHNLNLFLKAGKNDIIAGVPGKYLHAVIGPDVSDVGSVASTIMYAFYLSEVHKSEELCTVPVINMKRAELSPNGELKWLLDSCQIDQSSLVFADEIDLSYYELFGSLKLVLVNSDRLPTKQEALKEAIVEVLSCKRLGETDFLWVETVTKGEDCSCCTLIAEKFSLVSPEILAGQGFSRLLLAGILVDTGNLSNPNCTSKDKYMATLLINGAGRFGLNGLHQILKYKVHDVPNLKVIDMLLKDFKKWKRVGMSSIGISVRQLLDHEENSTREIKNLLQMEQLQLLVIVSGYYNAQRNFKREILIFAESKELMMELGSFFNSNASRLPLTVLRRIGLRDDIRGFEVNKVMSRRNIERILEEFTASS